MPIVAMSGNDWFDQMLGGIEYDKDSEAGQLYPFFVRVGVIRDRPPRHEFFNPYFLNLGEGDVEKVFEGTPLNGESLGFVFPERWMSIAEQQAFTHVLAKHPDAEAGKIKVVDILTSSPLIVGSFMREQIRIVSFEDDDKYRSACHVEQVSRRRSQGNADQVSDGGV